MPHPVFFHCSTEMIRLFTYTNSEHVPQLFIMFSSTSVAHGKWRCLDVSLQVLLISLLFGLICNFRNCWNIFHRALPEPRMQIHCSASTPCRPRWSECSVCERGCLYTHAHPFRFECSRLVNKMSVIYLPLSTRRFHSRIEYFELDAVIIIIASITRTAPR